MWFKLAHLLTFFVVFPMIKAKTKKKHFVVVMILVEN